MDGPKRNVIAPAFMRNDLEMNPVKYGHRGRSDSVESTENTSDLDLTDQLGGIKDSTEQSQLDLLRKICDNVQRLVENSPGVAGHFEDINVQQLVQNSPDAVLKSSNLPRQSSVESLNCRDSFARRKGSIGRIGLSGSPVSKNRSVAEIGQHTPDIMRTALPKAREGIASRSWQQAKRAVEQKNAKSTTSEKGNKHILDMMLEQTDEIAKEIMEEVELGICSTLRWAFADIIEPASIFFFRWNMLCLMLVLYASIMVPIKLGFEDAMRNSGIADNKGLSGFEIFLEIYFIADIFINFRIAYHHRVTGELVRSYRAIAMKYVRGWLLLDVVSSIPVEFFEVASSHGEGEGQLSTVKIVRTLKLFRLIRLMKMPAFERLAEEHDLLPPSMIRLLKLVTTYLLVLHWIACSLWGLVSYESGSEEWANISLFAQMLQRQNNRMVHMKFYEAYWNAFYWGQLCVLGSDMYPETFVEVLFTNCITLLGVATFAVVIGSASSLVANMDQVASELRRNRDRVRYFLRAHHVPRDLQSRVMAFKEYCEKHGKDSGDAKELFESLPQPLRVELDLTMKRRLIYTVDVFRASAPQSVVAVVRHLRSLVAVPDQVIIRQNDPADLCYFITQGHCRVAFSHFTVDGREKLVAMGSMETGQTFGEIALLDNCDRTCNVYAVGYVDLETLVGDDFHALLDAYEDLRNEFVEIGMARVDQSLKMKAALSQGTGKIERMETFNDVTRRFSWGSTNKTKRKTSVGTNKAATNKLNRMRQQLRGRAGHRGSVDSSKTERDVRFEEMLHVANSRSAKYASVHSRMARMNSMIAAKKTLVPKNSK